MASDDRNRQKEVRLATPSSTQADLVAVGIFVGAHGIKGQLKLRSYTAIPEDILAYGALLNKEGTKRFELNLDGATKHGLIVSLKGLKDRNAAELLKGTEVFADRAHMPEPDEEEFYYDQLIGLEVRDSEGKNLGKITALYDFGAGDIIEILLADSAKKEMYPFTRQNFPAIHIDEGFIRADLPEVLEVGGQKE